MIQVGLVIYLMLGIGFEVMISDNQPFVIYKYKLLGALVLLGFMVFWFPYFLINMCFRKRDIWFRRKTDD